MANPKLKRIVKLADRILNMKDDPEYEFDMNYVHFKDPTLGKTRVCIAGMAILMFGTPEEKAKVDNMFLEAIEIGIQVLGIDKEKFEELFFNHEIGRKEAAKRLLALTVE